MQYELETAALWGALFTRSEKLWLNEHHIHPTREEVILGIGRFFAEEGETAKQGWRRAYRKGWRAVRVVAAPWPMEAKKHATPEERPSGA